MKRTLSDWKSAINGYETYLALERGLSDNSIVAYLRDITKFCKYCKDQESVRDPGLVQMEHIERYLGFLFDEGIARNSQSRMLSGIRSFCKYMRVENIMEGNPVELVEAPKPQRKLPDVLTVDEISAIIGAVDLSRREGVRNKAMLEVLYSCGLRVTELCELNYPKWISSTESYKWLEKGIKSVLFRLVQLPSRLLTITSPITAQTSYR